MRATALFAAVVASPATCRSTPNSSPPSRATVSGGRRCPLSAPANSQRSPAPEAMLDSAAVTVARHELVELEANAVVSLEVVRERLAMQTAGRVVAYPFQHGIRLQDPAVQAERHDADGCSIEDRPKLSLAR